MKKLRTVVLVAIAIAALLLALHLAANANWPELLRSIHGR
jgi:hypothetical protein